jgi:phosphatidylglycerophosphate synthase
MAFSARPRAGYWTYGRTGALMMEGARELEHVVRAPVLTAPGTTAARPAIPVILVATEDQQLGAIMRVGGVRVVDRAIRQLARLRDVHVVIADDGSIPLPRRLPANMERRELSGGEVALQQLAVELGPETARVGADTVWLIPGRFDKGTRVVDAASRRLASAAVFAEPQRDPGGIIDRLINRRIVTRLTRLLVSHLPVSPALLTLLAGFVGLNGVLLVATGGAAAVAGFAVLQAYVILDGCAGELARVRLSQTAFGAWLDTVVGDVINVALVLALGLGLWRQGGTYLDMKMALAAAGMTLLYMAITYRELMRQREGDVMRLRWWFTYWQPIVGMTGAGSHSLKPVLMLGRRDFLVLGGLVAAAFDQLAPVLVYALIIATVRAGGALGQLLAPDWRIRPGS